MKNKKPNKYKRNREFVLAIMMTEEESEAIAKAAFLSDKTKSAFCRPILFNAACQVIAAAQASKMIDEKEDAE